MKARHKLIDQATAGKTSKLTIEEMEWLKKNSPFDETCIVVAPKYTPNGLEDLSEHDREMIKSIKAKMPELVFIELSKTDTQL